MIDPRLKDILALRRWRARPERLVMAGLAPDQRPVVLRVLQGVAAPFAQLIVEPDVLTLVLPEMEWRRLSPAFPRARVQGPLRAISFDLDLPADLVGFLAEASRALAASGVPILAICGYTKDHLLVRADDLAAAMAALDGLAAPDEEPKTKDE